MSARRPIERAPGRLPRIVLTTPVKPMPSVTSTPHSRRLRRYQHCGTTLLEADLRMGMNVVPNLCQLSMKCPNLIERCSVSHLVFCLAMQSG